MKLIRWSRFTWELAKLPAVEMKLDAHYAIRPVAENEKIVVKNTLFSAFSLDMDWSDTLKNLLGHFETELHRIFELKDIHSLVLTHGSRIIGASVLDPNPDALNHLVGGPAILSEYRNRGLGSKLLYRSLHTLHEAGVPRAHGIIKTNAMAAKYVYPKFNSTSASFDFEPRPATES